MSNYLLELFVIHGALMLGYWFFLRKERQYATLRFYLVGSTLAALIIPLLRLPKILSGPELVGATPAEAIPLNAVVVAPVADASVWNYELLIWGYVAISAFLLVKFLHSVIFLICLERKSSYEKLPARSTMV